MSPEAQTKAIVEVSSDVEEFNENLDLAEDDVDEVRDMLDAEKDYVSKGVTLQQKLDSDLEKVQRLRAARDHEAESYVARALQSGARRCACWAAKAPSLAENVRRRDALRAQLTELAAVEAMDESKHKRRERRRQKRRLREEIKLLDAKLTLFDARKQRNQLFDELLGARVTEQRRQAVQREMAALDSQLHEYDTMESRVIRKVRLRKWREELKRMLKRDRESKAVLHVWEPVLAKMKKEVAEALEQRDSVRKQVRAAKKELRDFQEREDAGQRFTEDEEDRWDDVKRSVPALQARRDELDEQLEDYDQLARKVDLKTKVDNDEWRQQFLEKKTEQQRGRRKLFEADTRLPVPGLETILLLTSKHLDRRVESKRLARKAETRRKEREAAATKSKSKLAKKAKPKQSGLMRVDSMADLGFQPVECLCRALLPRLTSLHFTATGTASKFILAGCSATMRQERLGQAPAAAEGAVEPLPRAHEEHDQPVALAQDRVDAPRRRRRSRQAKRRPRQDAERDQGRGVVSEELAVVVAEKAAVLERPPRGHRRHLPGVRERAREAGGLPPHHEGHGRAGRAPETARAAAVAAIAPRVAAAQVRHLAGGAKGLGLAAAPAEGGASQHGGDAEAHEVAGAAVRSAARRAARAHHEHVRAAGRPKVPPVRARR